MQESYGTLNINVSLIKSHFFRCQVDLHHLSTLGIYFFKKAEES